MNRFYGWMDDRQTSFLKGGLEVGRFASFTSNFMLFCGFSGLRSTSIFRGFSVPACAALLLFRGHLFFKTTNIKIAN